MSISRIASFVSDCINGLQGASGFRAWVRQYCESLEWQPVSVRDSAVTFGFRTRAGGPGRLLLVDYWPKVELSVITMLGCARNEISGALAAVLLQHNFHSQAGAWQAFESDDEFVFSFSHTIDTRYSTGIRHAATATVELLKDYEQFLSVAGKHGLL